MRDRAMRKTAMRNPARREFGAPPMPPQRLLRLAPLPREFYARDPRRVARELIGKLLLRRVPQPPGGQAGGGEAEVLLAGRIVEAEAYLGRRDPAAHAYRGLTARNAVLFGEPGHAYIYFIYGSYYCTNVSCQPEGEAGCVLLRALEPLCGLPQMAALRRVPLGGGSCEREPSLAELRRLTSGPGRLSQALSIERASLNGCDLCSDGGPLSIVAAEEDSMPASRGASARVATTPRIHVPRAPLPRWRYILASSPFVSGGRGAKAADA